ncbi:Glucan synthesis regulatory protein [Taphrina deformans PYCC 5710]|uniref:Glucan synthesis regulatory protein n=1 Tax=Taphrina deformans (strain PYCC 5710 / ATCC 11124 / CBS 356.35 / IMI 108563 / JCM 9778 / NBRC 8474) TaxID=1097556 RepID=R4XHF0_TAPDE|nr:Glucan synthesis regulatory protein [Taphrina deformans PYCC 5710]|eukprot:CCG82837.1 Glucan synthesis regulatory protein [Taphrina deformans PYCC 5710]
MKAWWNSLTSSNRHADTKKDPYNPSFTRIRTGLTNDSVLSLNKSTAYQSYDISSPSSSHLNLPSTYGAQFPGVSRRDTTVSGGGMAMQDFQDGVAPPPPVADSWRRIDRWTEDNYPELYDQLSYGATEADVDELEHTLEITLPGDVRESFYIHDGQERGGRPTGLFFGIALLDCEELVDEYELWRKVAASLPQPHEYPPNHSSVSSSSYNPNNGAGSRKGTSNQLPPSKSRRPRQGPVRQGSRPEGAIQAVYSHRGWIPLAKDYMGNNIAIDMSPGSRGRVGQVILFGRECDIKYVVAPSWAAFLASYVSDLESDHVIVDEDVGVGGEMGQLRYVVDLDQPDQQCSYLETLKARVRRRDRAVRGSLSEAGSSTSLHSSNIARKNGKGRAPSPLKQEKLPRSSLAVEHTNAAKEHTMAPAGNGGLVLDAKERASVNKDQGDKDETKTESDTTKSNVKAEVTNGEVSSLEATGSATAEFVIDSKTTSAIDTTSLNLQDVSLEG